jgi:hypothetical protein
LNIKCFDFAFRACLGNVLFQAEMRDILTYTQRRLYEN